MTDNLLAGPILRRATENRVCVWIATSQREDIRLEILSNTNKIIGQSNIDNLYSNCTQLGENLFIYLLEARCSVAAKFPMDEILTYQFVTLKQNDAGVIWDLSALAYGEFDKPSFYIPTKINKLLHGSCRKPHGGEQDKDALYHGDIALEQASTSRNAFDRPSTLLLTGDQIYADDVSKPLLSMLSKKAKTLIGNTEYLPVADKAGSSKPTRKTMDEIDLIGRKRFLKDNNSGFSSSTTENHLLSFGEYAAMYIYVFGNVDKWSVEDDWHGSQAQENELIGRYGEEISQLKTFEETLPNIRRLCANIPTYMIFDDHDVTDDWNITNAWYDDVRDSVLGHRIVSNALAAYWAFQGCGNDPDHFDMDFKSAISVFTLRKEPNQEIDEQFDSQTWRHRGWGFSVPTNPPIIAIDTRTQRESTSNTYLPILLDRYARDWLAAEWSKLKADPKITDYRYPVLITTTPVLGYAYIELGQRMILSIIKFVGNYYKIPDFILDTFGLSTPKLIRRFDIEAWATNGQGLFKLMDCLTKKMHIKQCVFLSGDVHYAFTATGSYNYKDLSLDCYQLTSSSIKNTPGDIQQKALDALEKTGDGDTKTSYYGRLQLPFLFPESIKEIKLLKFITNKIWETEVKLVRSKDPDDLIFHGCNLGLLEFNEGIPVKHTLINSLADREYNLPRLTGKPTSSDDSSGENPSANDKDGLKAEAQM